MDAKPFKIDFFAIAFECVRIRCNTVRKVFRFMGNFQISKTVAKSNRMIRKGTRVQWKWGKGTAEGEVMETYTPKTTKTIKGATLTRNGTEENRALFIKQDDGDPVLKSESEVERADT